MMYARKKCEHCVGSDVHGVVGVFIECETWLTRTGSISEFSGFNIVFSS